MAKEDCILFKDKVTEDGERFRFCDGLDKLYCSKEGKVCRFYKTREEYNAQLEKGYQREEYQEWYESQKKRRIFDGELKPV